jgi:hypothetical protein
MRFRSLVLLLLLLVLLPTDTLQRRRKHLAEAIDRRTPPLPLLLSSVLLRCRKALPAEAARQSLLLGAPSNTTLQHHMRAVGVAPAQAPLCFAGQYMITTCRTGQ